MNTKLFWGTIFFSALWVVMVLINPLVYACTAFMKSNGEKVLVGNNEDYKVPYTRVWFVPADNGRYGRVYFGYDNWSPQGGMNDQGLFFDFFAVKKHEVIQSKEKPKFPGPMIDTMMAEYATVNDVLKMFNKYNLEWMSKVQMFVVDRTGDSAIIEGDAIIRNFDAFQVVTNFRHSKIAEEKKPCRWPAWSCSRYKKAEKLLLNSDVPTVAQFKNILKETHRNNFIARTLYSNIYNLSDGFVYVYYLHNFDKEIVFNLKEELRKGHHYYDLPSLFGNELKYDIKTYRHPSPAFNVSYPKHFEVIKPRTGEVLLVKNQMGSTPQIGVSVENIPKDIPLHAIGRQYFLELLNKYSTNVKLVYSEQTALADGTPATEMLFDREINEIWPFKTMILSTYWGDKLVYVTTTSFVHPEALKEYLYSLQFH